ncbi:hypothetical protein ABFK60_001225 [Escherichia coli O13/129/135:H4]
MAVQDILNNSLFGQQYLLGDDSYNDQQTNALGQSTGPTPTQNGLPAVDPQNDLRTPLDNKQDLRQANFDTLDAQDTEGKTIGNDGFVFNTAPDTRKSQLQTGLIAFGMSMLAGENDGQALMRAGQATAAHSAMIRRQDLIPSLVKKGYASVDIQKYVESGNPSDLIVNKGKTRPLGDGIHTINDLTGEVQAVGTPQQKLSYHDLGDRVVALDAQGREVQSFDKGAKPSDSDDFSVSGATPGFSKNAEGDLIVTSVKAGKSSTRTATPEEVKSYNAQHPAAGKQPEETQMFKQYSDDVAFITAQPRENLEPVIGWLNMAPEKAQDFLTRANPQQREVYNRLRSIQGFNTAIGAKRFQTQYGTPVKSDADLAQANRLNPPFDTSSVEALQQTIVPAVDAQIEAQGWNPDKFHGAVNERQKSYHKPKQGSAAPQGGAVHTVVRGPDGKLIIQ